MITASFSYAMLLPSTAQVKIDLSCCLDVHNGIFFYTTHTVHSHTVTQAPMLLILQIITSSRIISLKKIYGQINKLKF